MTESALRPTQWRVEHIGSLLRPAKLKDAFARRAAGELSDEELRQAQDDAIRDVVAKQEHLGIPVVNDGEFRRTVFMQSFADVAGWGGTYQRGGPPPASSPAASGGTTTDPTMQMRRVLTEPLRLLRNRPLDEYRFASGLTSRPVKVTLIDTDRIRSIVDLDSSRATYPDAAALVADIVKVEREIVDGLAEAGCPYMQIDSPSYTRFVDPVWKERMRSEGQEPLAVLREAIEADNAVIEDHPNMAFGMHLCRGTPSDGGYHRQGTYDEIAELVFAGLRHERLLLEYDTERAGTFAPLRLVPKGKTVVLGLVSTKVPEIESVEYLERRIDEATKYIPVDQLAISPQCGFSPGLTGLPLTEDQQWRKLEVLLETATRVWGSVVV